MDLIAPTTLNQQHKLEDFCCGTASLDNWLKHKAWRNELALASRTYVLATKDKRVIGYYALATAAIASKEAPRKIKRNMPIPIPAMVLGRLAIDQRFQGEKFGDALLKDAILRVLQVAEIAGVKAIIVHAISEKAKKFYLDRSFIISPINPMTLMLPLDSLI